MNEFYNLDARQVFDTMNELLDTFNVLNAKAPHNERLDASDTDDTIMRVAGIMAQTPEGIETMTRAMRCVEASRVQDVF